jgi:hypothetical protein
MSTNALHHGLRAGSYAPAVPAELWIWARVTPAPQLVVTVFDTCRSSWPDTTPRDLLDEHGKGVGIDNVSHRHEHGVSLVSVPLAGHSALNVWVEPRSLAFTDPAGTRVRRPLVDLQDLAEHLVRRTEESREGR